MADKKFVTEKLNQNIVEMRYEVRGTVVIRAGEIEAEIAAAKAEGKPNPYPFEEIVYCNIGNPQQLNQKPLTFVQQVSAVCACPALMESGVFPSDVVERAQSILKSCKSVGSYSHSKGIPIIRRHVAEFVSKRDGHECDSESVFLTDGASTGVKSVLNLLISGDKDGVMIPIPQYPLYSASLTLFGGAAVPYYLDEAKDWELSIPELERSYAEAAAKGVDVKALVVINPNNPTGNTLTLANMQDIVRFCAKHSIVLLADEVYQENIYSATHPFYSFRKVSKDLGIDIELVSFHSVSKGFFGECGKRGGYFQLENIPRSIWDIFYRCASVSLCPNTMGQIVVDCMVCPPKEGEPSYPVYKQERDDILASLKRRAVKLCGALNSFKGFTCANPTGALYLFPSIRIPPKACEVAREKGLHPDTFYCLELLANAGICVVPGVGFGEVDGSHHFRTTFLPPEKVIDSFIENMRKFNDDFMAKYN